MLCDRCLCVNLSCLSVLSVTLVYCGQTVGWIKMKLGMVVGIRPGHVVLDGDPAPPSPKGAQPQFSAHVCCGQTTKWIKMPLGREVGLGPGEIVLDEDPAPSKGHSPQFSAHVCCGQTAGRIKMRLGTEVGLGPGDIVSAPPKKGAQPPTFRPMSIVAKRSSISATGEHLSDLLLTSYIQAVSIKSTAAYAVCIPSNNDLTARR